LKTNRYYLDHGHDNSAEAGIHKKTIILPPVYIHPGATIENSVIGPYVAIGANCIIQSSILRDCIIEDGTIITDMILEHSLIGCEARITGKAGSLNVGDQTALTF
jgi:glucose-1-phosphate thymidylyltransferase